MKIDLYTDGTPMMFSDDPMTRRRALKAGLLATAGLLAPLGLRATTAREPQRPNLVSKPPKATSVIQIWLWGGACHIDTFDPKPTAGRDFIGQFEKPIPTNVDGMQLNELLPLLAQTADKFSLIRSMTHGNNGHETASYLVQTGRQPGDRQVYPSMGAVVSLFKGYDAGYKGLIPPYVVLTEPQGRFSEAGFLGSRFKPYATGGDPAQSRFAVEGVVAPGITEARQQSRRELLHTLNTLEHAMQSDPHLENAADCEKQAYDLILGDAGKVFDLAQEPDSVRERYGRNTFGQSCLMARRLVEKRVPYITINYKGWDTHKQHFQTMRRKLPELDKGISALLQDLATRGLLGSTIVWCCGEFGRTPRVQWEAPWNGGRNHFGKVFSALVAGGGFKGGQVLGASNSTGEELKERPVYPCDLIGTMYDLLGIDSNARLPHPQGLDVRVTPPTDDKTTSGGKLVELI